MSASADKAELRRRVLCAIAELSQDYIERSDAAILEKLLRHPAYASAKAVFAYASVGREVSTAALLDRALSDGKLLALPVILPGGQMEFRRVLSSGELRPGRFGIPEPPECRETVVPRRGDIVIVPALCCDSRGNRLGHGAGYYDRFLSECSAASVCLCRRLLMQDAVPAQKHDVKVSFVLTD